MKHVRSFLAVVLTLAVSSFAFAGDKCNKCEPGEACGNTYGKAFKAENVLKVSDAKAGSENICVEGKILSVCQSAGCWLIINDGSKDLFVKAKGESFFMPKNSKGATAIAHGNLKEVEMSEATLKHFAEDGLKLEGEIKGPRKMLMLSASGVQITPAAGQKLESVDNYKCDDSEGKSHEDKGEKKGHEKNDHDKKMEAKQEKKEQKEQEKKDHNNHGHNK